MASSVVRRVISGSPPSPRSVPMSCRPRFSGMYQRDAITRGDLYRDGTKNRDAAHDSVCAGCCCGGTHHRDLFTGTVERGVHDRLGNSCLLAPNHDRRWAVRRAGWRGVALPGLQREATRTYGEPPTASSPKTRDQPEGTSWKRFRLSGNSDSTDISPIPPIHQTTQRPTNDSVHTPHTDAGATTCKAHRKQLVNVRTGQSRLADRAAQWFGSRRSEYVIALHATMTGQAAHCRVWLFLSDQEPAQAPAGDVVALREGGRARV
jgi:hypothetical protein